MSMNGHAAAIDAEVFRGASPAGAGPVRATRPRWLRIVGFALLAAIGLAIGAVAGMLIAVSSGLIGLC